MRNLYEVLDQASPLHLFLHLMAQGPHKTLPQCSMWNLMQFSDWLGSEGTSSQDYLRTEVGSTEGETSCLNNMEEPTAQHFTTTTHRHKGWELPTTQARAFHPQGHTSATELTQFEVCLCLRVNKVAVQSVQ